jgi:hypothetical protein
MADKYALGVDIAMIIISSLLVFSAASNEKIYDSAAGFKVTAQGKMRKSGAMLGMTPESVNKFNMLVSILGAAAVGAYGLSVVHKKADVGKPKGPGIYTAVFGFAVSIGLILSGVISKGLYSEVAAFKPNKQKAAKGYRDASYFMITVGAIALVLLVVLVAKKKKLVRFPGAFAGGSNGVSTFFTYK